jgi:small GTP-binding protein
MTQSKYKPKSNVLKLCLLGEGGVGKTTLTKRIITGIFDRATKMTIGVDFHLLRTTIFDPLADDDEGNEDVPQLEVSAQMWDFAGEERFRFMLPRYCKGAVGGVLCFDLSRYSTTHYIQEWYNIWLDNAPKGAPLILLGTKSDLLTTPEEFQVAKRTIREIAKHLKIESYYIISSKTGRDIHLLTNDLLIQSYVFNINLFNAKYGQ